MGELEEILRRVVSYLEKRLEGTPETVGELIECVDLMSWIDGYLGQSKPGGDHKGGG